MKKRFLSILLVLCMCLSLMPFAAFAEGLQPGAAANVSAQQDTDDSGVSPAGENEKAALAEDTDPVSKPGADGDPAPSAEPEPPEASAAPEAPAQEDKTPSFKDALKGFLAPILPGGISVTSIIDPDVPHVTYTFVVNGNTVSTQTVKNGESLFRPEVTLGENQSFKRWEPDVPFGTPVTVAETAEVTVTAVIVPLYSVRFYNNSGTVCSTVQGESGTVVGTGVTFPVGPTEAITGWYFDAGLTQPAGSAVTVSDSDIDLYPKVESGVWVSFDSDGGSYIEPQFVLSEHTAVSPAAPSRPGYDFDGWTLDGSAFDFNSELTANITLKAVWKAAKVNYTVIHWLENADDDEFSYKESETGSGMTGALTGASAKSYPGFTAQEITQQTIAGDGGTVVNVYYKRNVYEIKFYSYSGYITGSKEYTSLRITAKYGANISDKWPTYNGSNSWSVSDRGNTYQCNIDTMPLNGSTFYGPKTGNGSETAYYYVEVLPGESGTATAGGITYKLHHSDTSPGTGYTVTKEDKYAITGFTYASGTKNGGRYNNARFYYTRNSYNVVFVNNGETVNTEAFKYQADISGAGEYRLTTPPAGKEGYIFDGWYADPAGTQPYDFSGKTMPAQNITVYARWAAPVHTVTVYDANGSIIGTKTVPHGSKLDSGDMPAENQLGLSEGHQLLGWVTDGNIPFSFDTEIRRDYNLYPRTGNTNRRSVIYDANGATSGTAPVDSRKYADGTYAAAQLPGDLANSGKVFLGWSASKDGSVEYRPNDEILINGADVTLYAVWGDVPTEVTVIYHSNFGTDAVYTTDPIRSNGTHTVLGYDATGLPARPGYSFTGWSKTAGGAAEYNPGDGVLADAVPGNDLYAVWTANTDTAYTVEFYRQEPDGSYPDTPYYSDPRTGTTDSTVSVTDADKAAKDGGKYVLDTDAANIFSGTVAADGSLVLKLYFKLGVADYTVHYYWNGTTTEVAADETGSMEAGQTLSRSPVAAAGYTPVSSETKSITIGPGENVIIFYYYKNVELTANSGTFTYDGKGKSVSGYTGAPEGIEFSDVTACASGTDADEYPAVFSAGAVGRIDDTQKYIVAKVNDGLLEIKKRNVTLTSASDEKVYDGEPLTNDKITVSGDGFVDGEGVSCNVTGSQTVAGSSENSFSYELTDGTKAGNYSIESAPGTLTVTKRGAGELQVIITANSAEKFYDGKALSDHGCTAAGLAEGDRLADNSVTVSGSQTSVGSSDNIAEDGRIINAAGDDVTESYVLSYAKGTLTVKAQPLTITANSAEKQYDGTPLTDSGYSYDKAILAAGESVASVTVSGSQTEIGSSANVASEAKIVNVAGDDVTGNYDITYAKGTLTVTKRTLTVTGGSATKSYTGRTQGVYSYSVSGLLSGHECSGISYRAEGLYPGSWLGNFDGTNISITDASGNDVSAYYDVKLVPGSLTIIRSTIYDPTIPKTGDNSHAGIWAALMALSALGAGAALSITAKRKKSS